MKRILLGLLLGCLVLSLFIGCGKRENPVRTRYLFHEIWRSTWDFSSFEGGLDGAWGVKRDVYVYLPPMYDPDVHGVQLLNEGFSVLYLLHDLGGDNTTFASVYKVAQLADRLISEGQIQPMIIVMPDVSSLTVGGNFYTNSTLMGNCENYIIQELLARIDSSFHTYGSKPQEVWISDPSYRAISGLGMGGYGALKLAMDYDSTKFTAVSAMSPIASFESFLTRAAIDKMYEENGIGSSDLSYSSYKSLNPWTDSEHPDKTYSQLVFAMAAAFSPGSPSDPDTTNFITLITEGSRRYGVHLPFDSTRTIPPGSPIWNKWLLCDVKTKLANDHSAFANLGMYLDCGDQDELGLLSGARALDQLLSLYGKEHTYIEYSGYPGYQAGHDNFIFDRLEEILKFHSRNFPPPAYRGAD